MLQQVVRLAEDAAGLEKSLRLFQSFCTIAVGLASTQDLEFWVQLRSQFALGRRYFRYLKWHPCWTNASNAVDQESSLRTVLEVAKWSFLGMYFFLEMFTISNAMGVTTYEWAPRVQLEANRSWFVALIFSILLSFYDLLAYQTQPARPNGTPNGPSDSTKQEKPEGKRQTDQPPKPSNRSKIYQQLVIDSCDLFIPGAAIGWVPTGPLMVGIASTISTTVAGTQIWNRVQQKAK